jgi:hypothetical protein
VRRHLQRIAKERVVLLRASARIRDALCQPGHDFDVDALAQSLGQRTRETA